MRSLINRLSEEFLIPEENFEQDIKLFLSNNFKNSEGKFFPKFDTIYTFKSFLKNIAVYFWILIIKVLKIKRKLFFDIIVDDISHKNEIYRFKSFLKLFEKSLIISRVKLEENFKLLFI